MRHEKIEAISGEILLHLCVGFPAGAREEQIENRNIVFLNPWPSII